MAFVNRRIDDINHGRGCTLVILRASAGQGEAALHFGRRAEQGAWVGSSDGPSSGTASVSLRDL